MLARVFNEVLIKVRSVRVPRPRRGKTFESKERRGVGLSSSQIRLIAAGPSIRDECTAREATDGAPFTRSAVELSFAASPGACQKASRAFCRCLAYTFIPLQLDAARSLRFSLKVFLLRLGSRLHEGPRSKIEPMYDTRVFIALRLRVIGVSRFKQLEGR